MARRIEVEFVEPPEDFLEARLRGAPVADADEPLAERPSSPAPTPSDPLVETGNKPEPAPRIGLQPGRSYMGRYFNARLFGA